MIFKKTFKKTYYLIKIFNFCKLFVYINSDTIDEFNQHTTYT